MLMPSENSSDYQISFKNKLCYKVFVLMLKLNIVTGVFLSVRRTELP
jgi:hypothetical protein